jgi:hypothetical protein
MTSEVPIYLILFGAQGYRSHPIRSIRHIGIERIEEDGLMVVPRCNVHYRGSKDLSPRRFREAEGVEQDYPVCKRCLAWKEYDYGV